MENKINLLLANNIEDEFLSSHLLNYICVLISGHLEKNMQKIIDDYKTTLHCTHHECKDTIKSMRTIQNAKWCAIRAIFMNIDENILEVLKNELGEEFGEITDSINNMVKTRHKIAHGEDVITLDKDILSRDFQNIKKFIISVNETFGCL